MWPTRLVRFRSYSTKNSIFYITTPIYYVNATPHIGHLYSSVIADAYQKWRQILNPPFKVKFATGTDEHGIKIQQAASKHKTPVDVYCDKIAREYKDLARSFDIACTDFIRTSESRHKSAVQALWRTLKDNGYIYSAKYAGWYCISDETFLTESQLKETVDLKGQKVMVSVESNHPVEWTEEQNYMFRLSSLQSDLIHWLNKYKNVVKPQKFHKILLDMASNEELPDVSISRPTSRVFWGVEVPEDPTQTVYVWLDALANYLTVAGYPNMQAVQEVWPPDVQVIGKDILKFHGIYWPAFLMAAKLELPNCLLCHSHWTVDEEKMSKSKKNVVCPRERSETYTADGLRYFLLREGVAHSDGNYSDLKVTRILNAELADTFGNLLSRCCSKSLNPQQIFPHVDPEALERIKREDVTKQLMESVANLPDICEQHYSDFNFYKVVDATIATLHNANLFFETTKPWELKKQPSNLDQLHVVLHIAMETLRVCGIILLPIIPNISTAILNKLNVPETARFWSFTKQLSWNDANFKSVSLSTDNAVVFKRLVIEEETKRKTRKA